jgi:LysR family transcriptional regulator (chromosome initiation inhibitor)
VSQRVKSLEERLGAVLITRGAPCRATPLGAKLCAHAERVRLLETDVVAELPRLADLEQGKPQVRVAVNSDSLSTWFPEAAAQFGAETGALLDLILEDETYTADLLRSGEVLAAVTADPAPVVGCKTFPLGAIEYVVVASPAFMARWFPEGTNTRALQEAPVLRFGRRDEIQTRWVLQEFGEAVGSPTQWTPSTQGMLDLALVGLGWTSAPLAIARPHLEAGRLVELVSGSRLAVSLYWQRSRLGASLLDRLTQAVRAVARHHLVEG